MPDFRGEIVGLGNVSIMALFGLGIYSLSYGVTLAAASARPVPVLELWMAYTHLIAGAVAVGGQAVAAGLFGMPSGVPYVSDALVSLFLGVALAVTCLSSACLAGGVECGIYFPSAIFPAASAAGAIAWAWIMYAGALGCQTSGGLLQLGIGKRGGLTVAAVMACVQPQAVGALLATCMGGTRWDAALQWVPAGVLATGSALLFAGHLLPGVAYVIFARSVAARATMLTVATLLFAADAWFVHAPPAMSSQAFRVCMGVAAALPWVEMVNRVPWGAHSLVKAATTPPAVVSTSAGPLWMKRA